VLREGLAMAQGLKPRIYNIADGKSKLNWFMRAPLALREGLRRKERIFSLLTRHFPFGSQARLGTVPGYYQTSRCAGLDSDAANGVADLADQDVDPELIVETVAHGGAC
jgi:hypothetical protein